MPTNNSYIKTFILFIVCFVLVKVAFSQVTISGFVKGKHDGEPLIGANVFIQGTTTGIATNNAGFYSLQVPVGKTNILIASYIGYKEGHQSIMPIKDQTVNFYLEKGIELGEVEIRAPDFSEKRFGANLTEIPVSVLRQLPALAGETDLMRAYQLLPGIQGGSEGKAGMYVRGGNPDQNLVMLDGSPLYYVNHIGGFTSIFDPEAVKNFKLYKGGFPARFGGRLSSVLDVQIKEGDKNQVRNSLTFGIISGSFSTQGPVKGGKGSYFVSLRRVWLDLLMRPISYLAFKGASTGYNFYDFNSKFSWQLTEKDKVFLSVYSGDDKLILKYKEQFFGPDIKAYQKIKWGNLLGVARWEHVFSPKLFASTKISFTRYRFLDEDSYRNRNDSISYSSLFKSRIYDFAAASDVEYFLSNNYQIKAGIGIILHNFEPGLTQAESEDSGIAWLESTYGSNTVRATEQFLYIENLINLNHFNFNIGMRLASYVVKGDAFTYPEPRLSASYDLFNGLSLKTSYAEMHQFVHMLENATAGFATDFWVPATTKVTPGLSWQAAAGLEKETHDFQASIDLYYKKLGGLVNFMEGEVFQGSAVDWQERVETGGIGSSKGAEFFLYKKTGKITGWVSYTLSRADRHFDNINFGRTYPFKYDRHHDLSVVANLPVNDYWNFAATFIYGTGYPITLAIGKQTLITSGSYTTNPSSMYYFTSTGEFYGSRNAFRMRDYHRLDIGFTHTVEKYGTERIWNIGIYNVYNRQNPYYYFYKERKPWLGDYTTELYQASFLPIIPSVSFTYKW